MKMRRQNGIEFRENLAVALGCLCLLGAAAAFGLGRLVETVYRGVGQGVPIAGVDLYVKPKPEHPLKAEFPELFQTDGVVVTFSASWCSACRTQAAELRIPSRRFNIIKVAIEDEKGEKTRWSGLMDKWELGATIPVTVVVSKGEVLKVFHDFTPWETIKPHAEKANKNENDKANNVDFDPINIDGDGNDNQRRRPRP